MTAIVDQPKAMEDRPARVQTAAEARDSRDLLALVVAYPVGAPARFRTYDPTIRPRDWRHVADCAAWGLRRGDQLEVVGYGATQGFPDALLLRRPADGIVALVFPAELLPAPENGERR